MTLAERIVYFKAASLPQGDSRDAEELINQMTPYELLAEISDALETAGVDFNLDF